MNRVEALKLLKGGPEGVKKWNQWREGNPPEYPYEEIPKLERANLEHAHLEEANLEHAHLEEANLAGAHLEGARLAYAHLQKANLERAHLERAELHQVHLEEANLSDAILRGARLFGTNLNKADLRTARFVDYTHLSTGVHFEPATSRISDIIFPFYQPPYKLDENDTRDTRFHHRACDPWSVLRRNYTGTNMVFVLLFTVAAFLPVIAKAIFWSAVSRGQEAATPVAVDAVQRTAEFLAKTPDPAWTPWVETAQAFVSSVERKRMTLGQVRETLALLADGAAAMEAFRERASENAAELEELKTVETWVSQAQATVRILAPNGEIQLRPRRVFSLVLATDEGWLIAFLSAVLLLYNLSRVILTYGVGPLRDDEERVGVSPAWDDYRWLWRLHQFSSPVLVVSVLFGVVRILSALWATVLVTA